MQPFFEVRRTAGDESMAACEWSCSQPAAQPPGKQTLSFPTTGRSCRKRRWKTSRSFAALAVHLAWTAALYNSLVMQSNVQGYVQPAHTSRWHMTSVRRRGSSAPIAAEVGASQRRQRRKRRSSESVKTDKDSSIGRISQSCQASVQFGDLRAALKCAAEVANRLGTTQSCNTRSMGQALDQCVQAITSIAFAEHPTGKSPLLARNRAFYGLQAVKLQWSVRNGSAAVVVAPFDTVPRRTLLSALRCLTQIADAVSETNEHLPSGSNSSRSTSLEAYRVLQRLVTGRGLRLTGSNSTGYVLESDFNRVIHAFASAGNMNMAHQTARLQQRISRFMSLVALSILVKGYGRQGKLAKVQALVDEVTRSMMEPDIIYLNSVLDAYVNCGNVRAAGRLFAGMTRDDSARPLPNQRTFNTMLKGYASVGATNEAIMLANKMKRLGLWDAIATNTLVHAAVGGGDLKLARKILDEDASQENNIRGLSYVEGYTELIDAYAKSDHMDRALAIFATMRRRNVPANEQTFACLVGGLGRQHRLDQATAMLYSMIKAGFPPCVITYNTLFATYLAPCHNDATLDVRVDRAYEVFREMVKAGVMPNAVTVSTIVEALGRCKPPRVNEARTLIQELESQRLMKPGDQTIYTALIQTCGRAEDLKNAFDAIKKVNSPDLVAWNALMVACCRCDCIDAALKIFRHQLPQLHIAPDLITFSLLITKLIGSSQSDQRAKAHGLYLEMTEQGVRPDHKLIDTILKKALLLGQSKLLPRADLSFLTRLLRDASDLDWSDGDLLRRKRATLAVLGERLRSSRTEEAILLLHILAAGDQDDLFERKGWNQVDSSFKVWRSSVQESKVPSDKANEKSSDGFFRAKGWNDVDSGFRII